MTKRSLFEFQFAFNNCIRLIFIGMQSGLVNLVTGLLARERKWGPEFSRTFGIVPSFPRLADEMDEDNKSRATTSCLPRTLRTQMIMASDWYAREMRLIYARRFEYTSIRVTSRFF